jgi:PBSX family phage terminase large subunit
MKRIVDNKKLPPVPQAVIDQHWQRKFNITQFLFEQQLRFVNDPEPFKVAVCSRRAGKTTACAAHLIDTAINNKDATCLYITLSRNNARKLIWRELKAILKTCNLPAAIDETEMAISFQNNSIIYVTGALNASEIEKFRGLPIKLCYIDECQSFREYIKELIDDIISPALMDYAGSLCLIGTPGPVPTGYFHECSVSSNTWSKHHWTFWDNPHIALKSKKTHQELLDRELKRRGVTIADPSIQREWYGRWILDSDSLLLHYTEEKNKFTILPYAHKYTYILGIDVGFKDADALAVLAYSETDPTTYLVEELVVAKQGITELVEQIQKLQQRYEFSKMIMDMGGLGKKIGEEIIRRHSIPVEAADKTRKMENIEFLNDALRTGKFKAAPNSRFVQDSFLVEIDRDKSKPDKIVVSSRYHSDIIDAVLYAFKFSPAYAYTEPDKAPPKWGTKEWAEKQSSDMFDNELEGAMKEQEYMKWVRGES